MPLTEFDAGSGHATTGTAATTAATQAATPEPSAITYGNEPVGRIARSLTNPRHNPTGLLRLLDDAAALRQVRALLANPTATSQAELAKLVGSDKLADFLASIQAHGVNQPILLRPLPADRLADTSAPRKAGAMRPDRELVAGERRYFGTLLVGLPTIPAMTKPMTDQEVLEFQLVENLQREDLHPMEEAEGYERLCTTTGIKKEDVGAKIGKSRAYVYGRLKLLDLCADARSAFYDGKLDASRALLLARVPDEKLQLKALKEFTAERYGGATMSVRECSTWLQQNVMLQLQHAPFNIKDAALCPTAGACQACPKRTGADADLFRDIASPDLCTDPKCYATKAETHLANIKADAAAKGMEVIAGPEAKKLKPHSYGSDIKGYTRLDQVRDDIDGRKLSAVLGKDAPKPILFVDPHTHEKIKVLPTTVVGDLLKAKGHGLEPASAADKKYEADRAKEKLQIAIHDEWQAQARTQLLSQVRAGKVSAFTAPLLRAVLEAMISNDICNCVDDVIAAWGLPTDVEEYDAIERHIDAAPDTDLGRMVIELVLLMDLSGNYFTHQRGDGTPVADHLADQLGIDLTAIKAEAKATITAQRKAEALADAQAKKQAENAKNATLPAAQAGAGSKEGAGGADAPPAPKARGKAARLSAKDAKQGIAEAMQGIEPASSGGDSPGGEPDAPGESAAAPATLAVGARVKVNGTVTNPTRTKWIGKQGTITARLAPDAWDVTFKGRNGGLAGFHTTELEVVPATAPGAAS